MARRCPASCDFMGELWAGAIFLVRGELFAAHGGFVTREAAVGCAEEERRSLTRPLVR
jgi:hypothetical protein